MSDLSKTLEKLHKEELPGLYTGGTLQVGQYLCNRDCYQLGLKSCEDLNLKEAMDTEEKYWWYKCYLKFKTEKHEYYKEAGVFVKMYEHFKGAHIWLNYRNTGFTLDWYFIQCNTKMMIFCYKIVGEDEVTSDFLYENSRGDGTTTNLGHSLIDLVVSYDVITEKWSVQFDHMNSNALEFTDFDKLSDTFNLLNKLYLEVA